MFHLWYDVWLESEYEYQMYKYYNMRLGKYIYICGAYLNQFEAVKPQIPLSYFGIDNTGFPVLIRSMLERVSQLGVIT